MLIKIKEDYPAYICSENFDVEMRKQNEKEEFFWRFNGHLDSKGFRSMQKAEAWLDAKVKGLTVVR